jgi:CDGSH-type Zn-finger protein
VNYVTITPTDNGPYLVAGGVTVLDAEGNEYEVSDTTALCRCGHSSTKPFCDGSHERSAFAAVSRAVTLRVPNRVPNSADPTATRTEDR